MNTKIFIPKTCRVGFNERSDTYTKKLAYIIYYDAKGKLRKQASWENWIETSISKDEVDDLIKKYNNEVNAYNQHAQNNYKKSLAKTFNDLPHHTRVNKKMDKSDLNPFDFENVPTEGFVLNKSIHGSRYDWNPRETKCRVYDPRGWEFEIDIPNLLYILQNATSTKGKGLEGKFIYGWDGKELVLIPEQAPEFKQMQEFSKLQTGKIGVKDLQVGYIYIDKDLNKYVYMGKMFVYDTYTYTENFLGYRRAYPKERYVFKSLGRYTDFESTSGLSKFIKKEGLHSEYAEFQEELMKKPNYNPGEKFKKLKFEKITLSELKGRKPSIFVGKMKDKFYLLTPYYNWDNYYKDIASFSNYNECYNSLEDIRMRKYEPTDLSRYSNSSFDNFSEFYTIKPE